MKRKVIVNAKMSAAWRAFGLPRNVSVRFWSYLHTDIPENYAAIRVNRVRDGCSFRHHRIISDEDRETYLITIVVDDTTSADHLILEQIHCARKNQ